MATNIKVFLDISVVLTGFSETDLLGTGMLELYYGTLLQQVPANSLAGFFKASEAVLSAGDEAAQIAAVTNTLMPLESQKPKDGSQPVGVFDDLARNIIRMWYLGNWNGSPISSNAYVAGLVWAVAGTHPPGAKQPGFDSWSRPPIS